MSNKILCFISCVHLLLSSMALMKCNTLATHTNAWMPFRVPLWLGCFFAIDSFRHRFSSFSHAVK